MITFDNFKKGYYEAEDKDEFKSSHFLYNKRIPFTEKVSIAERIIKASHFQNNEIKLHTPCEKMLTVLSVVENYTDIIIDYDKAAETYDFITESNLYKGPYSYMNDDGYNLYCDIMDLEDVIDTVRDDFIKNEYETHAFISKQIDKVLTFVNEVGSGFISEFTNSIMNMDEDTIGRFASALSNISK